MKFKAKAADLNAALTIVSLVPPRAITPQGGSGYLFIVRGDTCYVYSRDSLRVARADFPVTDVEGEGAFIYPADYTEGFRFLQDEVISFEATSEGDTHTIKYSSGSGAEAERTSYDPKLMAACDKDVEAATNERDFSVAILREAIGLTKPFLAKPQDNRVEDQYKAIQVFDASNDAWAKGDGTLFAANGTQAFYFYCDAFKGKGLGLHGQHLPFISGFLAKCEGQVTIKTGQNMTFAIDGKGRVLGWAHHAKGHQKYAYYALKNDTLVFDVPVRALLNALKYTKTELEAKRDKIRLTYTAATNELSFTVVEGNAKAKSFPVPVLPKEESESRDFTFGVNLYHVIDLLEGAKGDRLEMRVMILPADARRPKETAMFRTIDEFLIDDEGKVIGGSGVETQPENTYRCRVTRFVPSKD
jgi:hypothetical protein